MRAGLFFASWPPSPQGPIVLTGQDDELGHDSFTPEAVATKGV
jgi:hypothetical protein